MIYEIIGRLAIVVITFGAVWFGTVVVVYNLTKSKSDGWGDALAALVFYGPALGAVAAGLTWWLLP